MRFVLKLFGILFFLKFPALVSASMPDKSSPSSDPSLKSEKLVPLAFKGGQRFPLEIDADQGISCDHHHNTCTASGRVVAVYGDYTLTCDRLTAYFRKEATENAPQTLWQIQAQGQVTIRSKVNNQVIYGQQGTYNLDTQRAVMTGNNLKLEADDMTITAQDSLEFWGPENLALAQGKAVVVRTNRVMKAETLKAYFQENPLGKPAIHRIEGLNNVIISSATEMAQGDYGEYSKETEQAMLTGNVKIIRKDGVMEGQQARVNLQTGISTLEGRSLEKVDKGKTERVRVLMIPRLKKES